LGKKKSNDVGVIGGDNKRAITACVSSVADGSLLPFQLIFSGTTKRVILKTQRGRQGLDYNFHFTMSENHWSNLESMK
jgi:hypothetical protein